MSLLSGYFNCRYHQLLATIQGFYEYNMKFVDENNQEIGCTCNENIGTEYE